MRFLKSDVKVLISRPLARLSFITFFPPSHLNRLLWRTSWKVMKIINPDYPVNPVKKPIF